MTSQASCTLIKVGGSLYDLRDLGARLLGLLASLDRPRFFLFPGGGAAAEAVRSLDRLHDLGEESAHWLALRALTMNAFFLHSLLPEVPVAGWPEVPDKAILDPFAFALADEKNASHLPHAWAVTSDSLAARAAHLLGAQELLLLKSSAHAASALAEGMTWPEAAAAGYVDEYFPEALTQAPGLTVRLVNLRAPIVLPGTLPCPRR